MPLGLRHSTIFCGSVVLAVASLSQQANAGFLFVFADSSGLSAEAEFTLINATTLEVRLKNTSTGLPAGFDGAAQLLTGLSWDFGHPGWNGDTMIGGGAIVIGPSSTSVNFDSGIYGPGTNVGGEWGYGNQDGTGALTNFISANSAQATPFGGPNLDSTANMDGPQAGLLSSAYSIPLGGTGAIQDEVVATLTLTIGITEAELLTDLLSNGTRVEYGSDAAFLGGELVPAPGAGLLFLVAGVCGRRRRSR